MDEYKEYYKLYFSTFWDLLKKSIGWEDIALLVLSLAVGSAGSYWWKGKDFMIEQVVSFLAYAMVPFIVLSLGYVLYFLVQTPVKINQSQNAELDKYNWNRAVFNVEKYDLLGLSGWGLMLSNTKSIALENVSVWLVGVRDGQKWNILENKQYERFGYINNKAELLMFESYGELLSGEKLVFAITAMESGTPVHTIRTEKRTQPVLNDVYPLAIDVLVKAKTNFMASELPLKLIRLNVYSSGMISIRKDYEKERN